MSKSIKIKINIRITNPKYSDHDNSPKIEAHRDRLWSKARKNREKARQKQKKD